MAVGDAGERLLIDLDERLLLALGFAMRLANDCELLDTWSSGWYLGLCDGRAEGVLPAVECDLSVGGGVEPFTFPTPR